MTTISTHLRQFPAAVVAFSVVRNDDEARRYWMNISEAITDGRWTVLAHEYAESLQPGLRIHVALQQDPQRRDRADQVLGEAFRRAGVGVSGTSSSGPTATQDDLTIRIEIGPRPFDQPQRWPLG
jgi:hypothetical protein